jgi:transketolase
VAWQCAVEKAGPSALCLTRQNVPLLPRNAEQLTLIATGAYVLQDYPALNGVILATGSEVSLALQVSTLLAQQNIYLRVISCPCLERFSKTPQAYQDAVLPPTVSMRIAIEAAHSQSWYQWVGLKGKIFGIDTFGESAPGTAVFEHFGFTVENLVSGIRILIV